MLLELKELVIVLAIALATLACARPTMLLFSTPGDFARRRSVWLLLTVAGFLSPTFWVFVIVAAPIMIWAGLERLDSSGNLSVATPRDTTHLGTSAAAGGVVVTVRG